MKRLLPALIILLLLISCGNNTSEDNNYITTSDNIKLAYTYQEGTNQKAVLLLHMLGKDKSDYDTLFKYLNDYGYTVLAIDFRGHGESELDYNDFTDEDWQKLVLDAEAGINYLEEQGYEQIAVVGASIGANAALIEAADDERVDTLILLSAGEDYHGLITLESAKLYNKPVIFFASYEDKDAAVAATKLFNAVDTEYKDIKLLNKGHGTEMLSELVGKDIVNWLENY